MSAEIVSNHCIPFMYSILSFISSIFNSSSVFTRSLTFSESSCLFFSSSTNSLYQSEVIRSVTNFSVSPLFLSKLSTKSLSFFHSHSSKALPFFTSAVYSTLSVIWVFNN